MTMARGGGHRSRASRPRCCAWAGQAPRCGRHAAPRPATSRPSTLTPRRRGGSAAAPSPRWTPAPAPAGLSASRQRFGATRRNQTSAADRRDGPPSDRHRFGIAFRRPGTSSAGIAAALRQSAARGLAKRPQPWPTGTPRSRISPAISRRSSRSDSGRLKRSSCMPTVIDQVHVCHPTAVVMQLSTTGGDRRA